MNGADWRQQQELERERYESTIAALNRCAKAGAKPEDLILIARECGINDYDPIYRERGTRQ